MDFDLSEDQQMLARTVADFAAKQSPIGRARRLRDDPRGWETSAWKQMGELGWLAIPFSEEAGGLGGTFVEVALVLEHLATTLVPEPYLASVVLAGTVIHDAGGPAQRAAWLVPMMEGDTSLALAYAERDGRYDHATPSTTARRAGDGYVLDGAKVWVLNGKGADRLVVTARLDGALELPAAVDGRGVSGSLGAERLARLARGLHLLRRVPGPAAHRGAGAGDRRVARVPRSRGPDRMAPPPRDVEARLARRRIAGGHLRASGV